MVSVTGPGQARSRHGSWLVLGNKAKRGHGIMLNWSWTGLYLPPPPSPAGGEIVIVNTLPADRLTLQLKQHDHWKILQ